MRVGQKQKKIDVNIPKLDDFIHKVYVMVARKIYKNVYLFEIGIPPLQTQKNYREMEVIIQECILNTVRESIPVESILRAYMDETVEEEVVEEIKEEVLPPSDMSDITEELKPHVVKEEDEIVPTLVQANNESNNRLSFNDTDFVRDENNKEETIEAPKTVERLEQISNERYAQRKLESEEDDDDNVKLTIFDDQPISLDSLDIQNISTPEISLLPDLLLDDIEVLT
jgi:hypothetical protein